MHTLSALPAIVLCAAQPAVAQAPSGAVEAPESTEAPTAEAPTPQATADAPAEEVASPTNAAPPAENPAFREALTKVLSSRCGEGLEDLRAAAQAGSLGEQQAAEQVTQACETVEAAAPEEPPLPSPDQLDRSGRGKLAIGASIFGIWTGIAIDILAENDDERLIALPPLLGLGAGLGASLWATREGPITSGQAWTIITGLDYGSYTGLLLSLAIDVDSGKQATGITLASGIIGGGVATGLAVALSPNAGDAEMVRSGGLYGFATGGLLAGIIQPDEGTSVAGMMLAGMDGGLVIGGVLASSMEISRNRMLLIDAGTLGGLVTGIGGSLLAFGTPDDEDTGRLMFAITLATMYSGLAVATYLTADMEEDDLETEQALALIHRRNDGGWQSGRMLVMPSFDPTSAVAKPVGAWMPIAGGYW